MHQRYNNTYSSSNDIYHGENFYLQNCTQQRIHKVALHGGLQLGIWQTNPVIY